MKFRRVNISLQYTVLISTENYTQPDSIHWPLHTRTHSQANYQNGHLKVISGQSNCTNETKSENI